VGVLAVMLPPVGTADADGLAGAGACAGGRASARGADAARLAGVWLGRVAAARWTAGDGVARAGALATAGRLPAKDGPGSPGPANASVPAEAAGKAPAVAAAGNVMARNGTGDAAVVSAVDDPSASRWSGTE
jgi:hypothetical protein